MSIFENNNLNHLLKNYHMFKIFFKHAALFGMFKKKKKKWLMEFFWKMSTTFTKEKKTNQNHILIFIYTRSISNANVVMLLNLKLEIW